MFYDAGEQHFIYINLMYKKFIKYDQLVMIICNLVKKLFVHVKFVLQVIVKLIR